MNGLMLDVLVAVARKDYEDWRRLQRQRQGQGQVQVQAKAEGRYKGRPEDVTRNVSIVDVLRSGMSWSNIQVAPGCSRATLAKLAKRKIATCAGG